mgnify:CR=1 FL=1
MKNETVLLNTSIVNYRICDSLPDGVKVIDAEDPTVVMKAVKNEVQLENSAQGAFEGCSCDVQVHVLA